MTFHDKILSELLIYKETNPEFRFIPRQRNTKSRLEDGFWFQGNENYAFVSLVDRSGGSNMTRSVGLVFWETDDYLEFSIEIVHKGEKDTEILNLYEKLKSQLGEFTEVNSEKFNKFIGNTSEGFNSVFNFLDVYYPIIVSVFTTSSHPNLIIDEKKFQNLLLKIKSYKNEIKKSINKLLINITWNSKNWKEESDDNSNHRWVKDGGKPGESLNFAKDAEGNTEEHIYGYAKFTHQPKIEGTSIFVFYSQGKIVGFYGNAEITYKKLENNIVLNLKGNQNLSFVLENKIENAKELGFLEDKERVGMINFNYLEHDETIVSILNKALELNPNQKHEILRLKNWFFEKTNFKEEEKIDLNKIMIATNLNQILYGPPGTGKTYHTINKSLEIIGENIKGKTRKELKELFDKKVKEKQINFTTFHQSMSYEDFIEGIKPVLINGESIENSENESGVQYELKDGIFKELCNNARGVSGTLNVDESIDFRNKDYYKMSLGGKHRLDKHNWSIDNNLIFLGWGGDKDFSSLKNIEDWKTYRDTFIKQFPKLVDESKYVIQAVYIFQKMKIGDIVVISKGNHIIDAVGIIESEYFYDDSKDIEFYQFRKVRWLATNLNASPDLFIEKAISQQTIYQFYNKDIKHHVFEEYFKVKPKNDLPKKYVLIIDEINRGNVSQIFGELITLIEEDKRLGKEEALEVTLPYSKEKFGVPQNLHIIGTMNTADRSVEALDTALRRRFSFEEMLPKPTLLSTSAMYCRLLWEYKGIPWNNKEFLEKENAFFELFGRPSTIDEKKKVIWETMKTENNQNKFDYFNDFIFNLDLEKLLQTINQRIEILLDRDHIIGHSYFMKVNNQSDLNHTFTNNIIPLLQEYFYGDYEKIGLVLGKGFFELEEKINQNIFADFYTTDISIDKSIYKLKTINDDFPILEALKELKIQD